MHGYLTAGNFDQ